jgi:hypothetical protein
MAFFDVARETGWTCEKVLTERFAVRVRLCFGRDGCLRNV